MIRISEFMFTDLAGHAVTISAHPRLDIISIGRLEKPDSRIEIDSTLADEMIDALSQLMEPRINPTNVKDQA